MEDVRRCKKRGKRGPSWTSAKKTLAKTVALGGGGDATDALAWGLGQFRQEAFWKAAGGYKTVAGTYFRGSGACTQYDPKVILGAKTLDPSGVAYYGSQKS